MWELYHKKSLKRRKEYCLRRDWKRTIVLIWVQCGCLIMSWNTEDGSTSPVVKGAEWNTGGTVPFVIVQPRKRRKWEQKGHKRKWCHLYTRELCNEWRLKQRFRNSCTQRFIYALKLFQMGQKSLIVFWKKSSFTRGKGKL